MRENRVDLSDHFPKIDQSTGRAHFDLIVNMSGYDLPEPIEAPVRNWLIRDPIGQSEDIYRDSRDSIERQVMQLILLLRREARGPAPKIPAKT